MAIVTITTHLNAPPDQIWDEVNKPRLLLFVAHPLIRFKPVKPEILPERWGEGDYILQMSWHGILPLGQQIIGISKPTGKNGIRFLRDKGRGGLVRNWDHLISVQPEDGGTRYTDQVEINAGVATPIVVAFARKFYTHRQKRWRKLVKSGFDYSQS